MSLADDLRDVAGAFGPGRRPEPRELFLATLVENVGGRRDDALALGVELVYEGYLAHYRTSRTLAPGSADATRLLAGDYFYAHGLRSIAGAGDVEAVGLLTQLMASCSFARLEGATWSIDDDLWVLTVAAVAAGPGAAARDVAVRSCAAVRAAIATHDLGGLAAAAAEGRAAVLGVLDGGPGGGPAGGVTASPGRPAAEEG